MKAQSPDTRIEVELVLIDMIRKAPVTKRFHLIQSMVPVAPINVPAWQRNHPDASEQDAAINSVALTYNSQLAQLAQADLATHPDWRLQPLNLLECISGITDIFDELSVSWYLGGSIASSLHGMRQLAQDIDLVVDFPSLHLSSAAIARLKQGYILDEDELRKAIDRYTPYSLLQRSSLMKIDLIPAVEKAIPFSTHVDRWTLDERYPAIPVASAHEMILLKLYRYCLDLQARHDGMVDDAQWNDVTGMVKVQGAQLDLPYMEHRFQQLGVADTWHVVLVDCGLQAA